MELVILMGNTGVAYGVGYLDGERGDSYSKEFVTIVSSADLLS